MITHVPHEGRKRARKPCFVHLWLCDFRSIYLMSHLEDCLPAICPKVLSRRLPHSLTKIGSSLQPILSHDPKAGHSCHVLACVLLPCVLGNLRNSSITSAVKRIMRIRGQEDNEAMSENGCAGQSKPSVGAFAPLRTTRPATAMEAFFAPCLRRCFLVQLTERPEIA